MRLGFSNYFSAFVGVLLCASAPFVQAEEPRVLYVGPEGPDYYYPSEAANEAQDGDKIIIAEGSYEDCAVWRANNLTIVGEGEGAEIHSLSCQGKGIFVTNGKNLTVENITFRGARVPDKNGAGIRIEGANLTIRNCRFIDNENGILGIANDDSTITIENSHFEKNGNCVNGCSHGIYLNRVAKFVLKDSTFKEQYVAHHVKSRAVENIITGNEIHDGANGTASYLIDISNGGTTVIRNNVLSKGPRTSNRGTAIFIGPEGDINPSDGHEISNNRFRNMGPSTTAFVRNNTDEEAVLRNNRLAGDTIPLVGPGKVERR